MDCAYYKKYNLGKVTKERFQTHLKDCPKCRESLEIDQLILRESGKLKYPISNDRLWPRIENDLLSASQQKEGIIPFPRRLLFLPLPLKITASFILLAFVGLFLIFFVYSGSHHLLGEGALKRVQKIEKEYIAAIWELEKSVYPKMQKMNLEISLLYKDRLQVIDEQIKVCQEELKNNPVNTHLRRYLLAALKDKKKTLLEISKF